MGTDEVTGRSLESWRTAVLFVAGGLWLVDTALFTLDGVIAVSNPDPVAIKLAAILASAVGVLGLYPRLADRTPRFARAGGALLAFAGGASIAVFVLVLSREAVSVTP